MLLMKCPAAMQVAPSYPGLELPALDRWRAPPWHPRRPGDEVELARAQAQALGPGVRSRQDGLVCYSSEVKEQVVNNWKIISCG